MTNDEFYYKISKPDKIQDFMNYLLCGGAILGGLIFLKDGITQGLVKGYIASILFIALGIYGFWKIPKDYQMTEILTDKPIEEKKNIIDKYQAKLKVIEMEIEDDFYRIRYKNRFAYHVDLNIFFDSTRFLLNAKVIDRYQGKGIIDFGIGSRATKKNNKRNIVQPIIQSGNTLHPYSFS